MANRTSACLQELVECFYPKVTCSYVLASQVDGDFVPCSCGMGEDCRITKSGHVGCGWLLTMAGPVRFEQRQWLCHTHRKRKFSMFEPTFAKWLYSPGSPYTWDMLQPEPLCIKYGETYYSHDLLTCVITLYESTVTVKQIVDSIQQMWLAQWQAHRASFLRHKAPLTSQDGTPEEKQLRQNIEEDLPAAATPYWVHERGGQNLCVDRSKITDLIMSYFNLFLRPQYDADVKTACQRLCYGISIDETFQIAAKCNVAVLKNSNKPHSRNNIKYVPVPFCLHTVHSSVTQMMVANRWMPTKDNKEKCVAVKSVFQCQADAVPANLPSIVTRFVASDSPAADASMLRSAHKDCFPESDPDHAGDALDVGDDVWHGYWRIARELPSAKQEPRMYAALKKVFHCIYEKASAHDKLPSTDAVINSKDLCSALDSWVDSWDVVKDSALKAVEACKKNAHHFFTFLKHADKLVRFGTTANEHGHWSLNRRMKFASHVRPDHCETAIQYQFFLHNSNCARAAASNKQLSEEDRLLCTGLFVKPDSIPFHHITNQHPCVIPLDRRRTYTADDFQKEFGEPATAG